VGLILVAVVVGWARRRPSQRPSQDR